MSARASQITNLTIVYSTVYSRARSMETSKLRISGLCAGNSPVTGEFPAQRSSNAKNASIWWRHQVCPWSSPYTIYPVKSRLQFDALSCKYVGGNPHEADTEGAVLKWRTCSVRGLNIYVYPELLFPVQRCNIDMWNIPLHWCHNERFGVSNHQHLHHLRNCWFRRRSKKSSNLRVTYLCVGNSPVTGEFPTQKANNAENVSI